MTATPETITVDGTTYHRHPPAPQPGDLAILVLQRGWVFIGTPSVDSEAGVVNVPDARCIRRWGTSKGLGELAAGPTPSTEIDMSAPITYHPAAEVFRVAVDQAAWS